MTRSFMALKQMDSAIAISEETQKQDEDEDSILKIYNCFGSGAIGSSEIIYCTYIQIDGLFQSKFMPVFVLPIFFEAAA